jgi:hypothetical protein
MKRTVFTIVRFRKEHRRNEAHVALHADFNAPAGKIMNS